MSTEGDVLSQQRRPRISWVVVPREQVPGWLPALISLGAVVVALLIGAVILALAGGNPRRDLPDRPDGLSERQRHHADVPAEGRALAIRALQEAPRAPLPHFLTAVAVEPRIGTP